MRYRLTAGSHAPVADVIIDCTWITMWVIAVDNFGTEHIATTRGTNLVHKSRTSRHATSQVIAPQV